MKELNKLWIALPVYNEGESVEQLYGNLIKTLNQNFSKFEIVICDDGCTDESSIFIESLKDKKECHVIKHKFNRGLAESVRDIFEYVCENSEENDLLIRMDGDATHNPKYLKSLTDKALEGFDVVVAKRLKSNDKNLSYIRRIYSLFGRYFIRIFFRLPKLNEYTGGFRCYKTTILKDALNFYGDNFIQLKSFGFVCTFEKLVKLYLIGSTFAEVPFELEYDKKVANSKMIPWITILGYILIVPLIYWPKTGWSLRTKKFRN